MAEAQKAGVTVVVVLEARAPGCRHRQPFANVHGIVFWDIVAPVSVSARVRPVVLNHVDPQREDPHPYPQDQREREAAGEEVEEVEARELHHHRVVHAGNDAHRQRPENRIGRHVLLARIRKQAEPQRPPEAVVRKLVRVAGVVGIAVMQSVAVYPRSGVDVDAERGRDHRHCLDEPLLVVERAVRDAEVEHVGEVEPTEKPDEDEVPSPDEESVPRAPCDGGGNHARECIDRDDQIAVSIV